MTTHYISQTEITLEKYLDWASKPIGKKAVKKQKQRYLITAMGMLISIAGGIFCIKMDAAEIAWLYLAFFVAFAYKITLGKKKANEKVYYNTLTAMGSEKWIRTITFGSNVQVADGNSTTTFKYSDFRKLGENDRYYLLYRSEDLVLRVEKGSFITGDEAEFKGFITSRIKNRM